MHVRPSLLLVLLRGPCLIALPFSGALVLAVLFPKSVLAWHDELPLVLLVLLAGAFSASLGGKIHRFLVTRGFSSNCLWGHTLIAGLVSLLLALAPAALIIWLGLRSRFQESVMENPLYPLMASGESMIPLVWLAAGLLLFAAALFARIRTGQPTDNPSAGFLLFAILALALILFFYLFPRLRVWQYALAFAAELVITLTLLLAERFLHRTLEFPQ